MTDIQPNKMQVRFKELRIALSLNQVQFAKLTTIKQSHVSAIERGVKNITGGILILLEDKISANRKWIETGVGKKFIGNHLEVCTKDATLDTPNLTNDKMIAVISDNEEYPERFDASIPIYDSPISQLTKFNRAFVARINHPIFAGCDAVMRAKGIGMQPLINEGYLIGVREIDWRSYFSQGKIYVVITKDFEMLNYVHKSNNKDFLRLTCENKKYVDEELPKSEILSMWHVKLAIPAGNPITFN